MSKSSEKWLKDYETIERLVQTISQTFNDRSRYPKSSSNYSKLTISIRTLIGKLNANVTNLSRSLDEASSQGSLTQLELNRRVTMVNQLKTNEKQFEQMLRDDSTVQKDLLINGRTNDSLFNSVVETPETMNISSDQLLIHQDRIILDQDRGLETLTHIVRNQKQIAITIGNEVDKQNVLIDSMENKMDQIQERLVKETKHIRIIDRKSTTWGIWFIIILLLIAIIVIAAIPK